MSLDYANIMGNSQALVPDFQQQLMNEQQLRAQRMQNDQQQQLGGMVAQAKLRADQRRQQFEAAVTAAVHSGDPRAITRLMIEFPEFAEQLKPGVAAQTGEGQQRNLTQMGTIYARAQAGDFTGAASTLSGRIAADKAAGLDTADDEELMAGLQSPDADKRKVALATVGIHLAAAAGPDHFGDTYGKLNPTDKISPKMREYNDRVAQFGKQAADEWLQFDDTKIGPAGGIVLRGSDFAPGGAYSGTAQPAVQSGGGDPASSGGYAFPVHGGTFGQGVGAARDGGKRKHNGQDIDAPLGTPVSPISSGTVTQIGSDPRSGTFVKVKHADGSTSSYSHLGTVTVRQGDSIAPGQTLGTVGTTGNATGPVLHLVMRDPNGNLVDPRAALGTNHGSGPVKVKSLQQANALPKGTHYITPDGQEFVR